MKRPKGPELKMPDLKVPTFLEDVYWDLRDRRLLPLVAVIVVAIIAAPFVLGGDAEVEPPSGESPADEALAELSNAGSNLVVVEAKPGLRDYRKRLAGTPTDPFRQPLQGNAGNGAQLPTGASGEASSIDNTTVTVTGGGSSGGDVSASSGSEPSPPSPAPEEPSSSESKPPSSSPNDGGDKTNGGGSSGELTLFTFAIDVRITRSGGKDAEARKASKESEPVVKHRVLPQTSLPGEKAPVVTYMGMSRKGNALLLVSTDVKSVFGETKCVTGDDACQLIEAEPGFPVTFVYGYNEVHYTFNILKIEPVAVKRVPSP